MTPELLQFLGLVLNTSGAIGLAFFNWPQPQLEGGVSLAFEDNTPFEGTTAGEYRTRVESRRLDYKRRSGIAVAVFILGFVLQAIGQWIILNRG